MSLSKDFFLILKEFCRRIVWNITRGNFYTGTLTASQNIIGKSFESWRALRGTWKHADTLLP